MANHDVQIDSAVHTSTPEQTEVHGTTLVRTMTIQTSAVRNTVIDATIARIREEVGTPTAQELEQLDGKRVTLMLAGETMLGARVVVARPGTIFGGGTAILPKGRRKNGYVIDPSKVVALTEGYDPSPLVELYQSHSVGDTAEASTDLFSKLPHRGETCSLAVVVNWEVCGTRAPGCMWLCHSYMADDDIVEGMFVVPSNTGLVSEHGSVYGRQLIDRAAAVLTGAKPVSFSDAINLDSLKDAYEAIGL